MASPYADKVIADGAVAYWRLDEASGNALSQVGNFPGTVTGGVTRGQPGALADGNTAMAFDGTTGKIVTAATVTLATPFAVECWLRPTAVADHALWGTEPTGTGESFLSNTYVSGPSSIIGVHVGANDVYATVPRLDDGRWHHAVFSFPGGTSAAIYIDGVVALNNANALVAPLAVTQRRLDIGSSFTFGDRFWNGGLDEVAIYPTALTLQQIAAHYALRTATAMPAWHDLRYRYCRFVRSRNWRRYAA